MRLTGIGVVAMALGIVACGPSGDEEYADRMATEHAEDVPAASEAARIEPKVAVDATEVEYASVEGEPVTGYLARPSDAPADLPGLVVIHEWWGLNDNVRAMTRRLAGEGYLALAVDLYGGSVTADPGEALALMTASMEREGTLEENLRQARTYLSSEGAARAGVLGWCFGGGWSLRTGLILGDDIGAVVIYYGRLVTDPEALDALTAPVLGLFGSADQGIPLDSVRAFETAMNDLGKTASIYVYHEAEHAFANPSGTRYNAEAAADAWAKTLGFLEEHLR